MRSIIISLILTSVFLTGCGEKNPFGTVYVEGIVTLDGTPIKGVTVTLSPQGEGMSAGGTTDATGKFMLTSGGAPQNSGAKPGTYEITFYKKEVEGSNLSMGEYMQKYGGQQPPITYLIPQKYGDPKTSGIAPITVDIDKEKNKFSFDLLTK